MNLRILKKLSKRAAPYLQRIGDTREQYKAIKGENYHGKIIRDMTRLDRFPSCHNDVVDTDTHVKHLQPKCRQGTRFPYVHLCYPSQPLKGTIMVGSVSGYDQPEWDEETAWGSLENWVWGQFFEYDPENDIAFYTREFRHPSEIFAAADELLS